MKQTPKKNNAAAKVKVALAVVKGDRAVTELGEPLRVHSEQVCS